LSTNLKILAGLGALALAAFALLHTGLARTAFFELFAYVKGVDVLGPTIVRELPTHTPYQAWLERARGEIPLFEGLVIDDVATIALQPWPELGEGITGLYLRFADYQIIDGRILEIPPGGNTSSQRQLYEQGIYFIAGSGYTLLQQEGEQEQRVAWRQGDLLSVPLNVRHQHFSAGDRPARMLVVSSFPLVLNVMNSEEFIDDNPFVFSDRYDGSPDYFAPRGNDDDVDVTTNFVRDTLNTATQPFDYMGEGNRTVRLLMAGNSMLSLHVLEMPPQTYMKAHRHSSDAFILMLSGEGFSVAWPEDAYRDRVRVDWHAGTLFVPPTYWYHQHLNTGPIPARHLAINTPTLIKNLGVRFIDQLEVDIEDVRDEWQAAMENTAREQ
jgi:uncharacterized RmlC-like cupin family protein